MNPMQMNKNRTARLVREAQTPVYSTATPVREHVYVVELEHEYGYRRWVSEKEADELLALPNTEYSVSDEDHSTKCWCFRG